MANDYSGRPLIEKLGIKPQDRVLFKDMPLQYEEYLGQLPQGVTYHTSNLDFIQVFVTSARACQQAFIDMRPVLHKSGMLWVCWPKALSRMSDLDENRIRQIGLDAGLVDVKVISVDPTWSGLKFVYRLVDRA